MQISTDTMEINVEVPEKLKTELSYDTVIPHLSIYPSDLPKEIQAQPFFFHLLLWWVGLHCGIYTGSYILQIYHA
jgi:hypothetical protein